MAKCEQCDTEFEAKRASAKYCSTKCRVKAGRGQEPKQDSESIVERMETAEEAYQRRLKGFMAMGLEPVRWISTGIKDLDAFQKIPRGRVTQIQGPASAGKTTLALNMIIGLRDKKVFYIDTEAALTPELLSKLELEPKSFTLFNSSAFIEDMYDEVLKAARGGKYDVIIVDSIAACTFKTEAEGMAADRNIGQKALIMNKLMRVVPMILKETDTALVVINQEREVINSYAPQKYTPGGMGAIYAASLILGIKTIPSWRFPKAPADGMYKGHEVEVKILKSKVSHPYRVAKIKLYYPAPQENTYEEF